MVWDKLLEKYAGDKATSLLDWLFKKVVRAGRWVSRKIGWLMILGVFLLIMGISGLFVEQGPSAKPSGPWLVLGIGIGLIALSVFLRWRKERQPLWIPMATPAGVALATNAPALPSAVEAAPPAEREPMGIQDMIRWVGVRVGWPLFFGSLLILGTIDGYFNPNYRPSMLGKEESSSDLDAERFANLFTTITCTVIGAGLILFQLGRYLYRRNTAAVGQASLPAVPPPPPTPRGESSSPAGVPMAQLAAPLAASAGPPVFSGHGVQFQHPAGWLAKPEPLDAAGQSWQISLHGSDSVVQILRYPGDVAAKVLNSCAKQLRTRPEYEGLTLKTGKATLGNLPAMALEVRFRKDGIPHMGQVYTAGSADYTLGLVWTAPETRVLKLTPQIAMIRNSLAVQRDEGLVMLS